MANMLCSSTANHESGYAEQKQKLLSSNREYAISAALFSLAANGHGAEDGFDLFDIINALSISQEDKLRRIAVRSHPKAHFDCVFALLEPVIYGIMRCEKSVKPIISEFITKYGNIADAASMIDVTKGFVFPEGCVIEVYPYLFNSAMITSSEYDEVKFIVQLGALRYLRKRASSAAEDDRSTLETPKSISDASRLGILRCLKEGELYGQELAKRIGLYSTTISHHMAKLTECRIVKCRFSANKAYYSIDEESASLFIQCLSDILMKDRV